MELLHSKDDVGYVVRKTKNGKRGRSRNNELIVKEGNIWYIKFQNSVRMAGNGRGG